MVDRALALLTWAARLPPTPGVRRNARLAIRASTIARAMGTYGRSFPAVFARGGTSNGLVVRADALPPRARWGEVLPAAMGSPDRAHGRQLDGMGSGASSTSKVCVLAPPARPEVADVDFTFVQVGVRDGRLDLAGNCGNMLSVVGPVALGEGDIIPPGRVVVEKGNGDEEATATVRIFNTNTSKVIRARFRVTGDDPPRYVHEGGYAMDGVPGTGSRVALSFLDPAGAKTGRALPTGRPVDVLALPDGSRIEASLVDVSNPGVFVRVEDLGLGSWASLDPPAVEADAALKAKLEDVRRAGAAAMGLDPAVESVPKIVVLFPAAAAAQEDVDIRCLAMSMGQAHKAVPLTLALCLGAASRMPGTIPAQLAAAAKEGKSRPGDRDKENEKGGTQVVAIGHPSGRLDIGTTFGPDGAIRSAELYRTARVLMKGEVFY